MNVVKKFFVKYYNDNRPRRLLFGINPGRFGGGITGINFTAPRQLKDNCSIDHPFGNSSELSREFIYEIIEEKQIVVVHLIGHRRDVYEK